LATARTIALKLEYHLFKKDGAVLRRIVPARVQAALRRHMRAQYLLWDARQYRAWLDRELAARKIRYDFDLEPGLLSLLTPVWDGTPLPYFRLLAESVIGQNASGAAEWVILNNGCQNPEITAYLDELKQHSWIVIRHSVENAGIIGGLRLCLEAATGRYILPVDADDWLYPDCLRIVTWGILNKGYPPLLYTDEDKVIGAHAVQPYLKPTFDPVLLLNSAYIAHLGVIDRTLALKHDAYSDETTEGSPDWDLFTRFFVAGEMAVHIPEVVYSWRMHPESTSDDAGSKPYIHSSQKAVLQRYLDTSGLAPKYEVEYSPLLKGSCDWWLHRRPVDSWTVQMISLKTGVTPAPQRIDYPNLSRVAISADATLKALAALAAPDGDLVCLVSDDLEIDRTDWVWEAMGLFERYPDTVMVGGRIRNKADVIMSAGCVLGFGGGCHCPDRGRPALDPGYFTQMLKQRSVSAVSSQFAVLRLSFLQSLANDSPGCASLALLGAWAGAYTLRFGKRIVYSPYLSGVSDLDWEALPTASEIAEFERANADLMPDCRFYPRPLARQAGQAYKLFR
jgi:glycosyltransferase involved in cell wall biosynthesis